MNSSDHLTTYREAARQWAKGMGERDYVEWMEEVRKFKEVWRVSVAGLQALAESGNPEIWHELGNAYRHGHGVERDFARAEEWYRKSAAAGYAPSMVRLGQLLSHNEPTPEQLCESVDWFRLAADLGDSGGMTSLGFAYREGRGVPSDDRQAADWFIKAYGAGVKNASELAGRLLSRRPENHGEAVRWLRVAVEHECDSAYYDLALMHEDRRSSVYDPEEAFHCWIQVAERPRGDLRFMAMFTLARCCRDGIGTERNRENAIAWLDRLLAGAPAGKADYRDAAKLKQEIEGDLF